MPYSPCIHRGTDTAGVSEDFDGEPRPIGHGFDMGADEVTAPCPGIYGDVNDDGSITAADAMLAFQIALGMIASGPCELWRADVEVDGHVTAADAACIYFHALDLPSCLD